MVYCTVYVYILYKPTIVRVYTVRTVYRAGRAWKRSTSRKRRYSARALGHLHDLFICGSRLKSIDLGSVFIVLVAADFGTVCFLDTEHCFAK